MIQEQAWTGSLNIYAVISCYENVYLSINGMKLFADSGRREKELGYRLEFNFAYDLKLTWISPVNLKGTKAFVNALLL